LRLCGEKTGEETLEQITRRTFIIKGSIAAGTTAGGLALGGELLSPQPAGSGQMEFLETRCESPQKPDGKKILIAYASYCGSTGAVAGAIGQALCDRGAQVEVRLMKNVNTLLSFDAVILGSSVRSASWPPEAIAFVEKNQGHLTRVPVAYFLTCLALVKDSEDSRRLARSYFDPVLKAVPTVRPVDLGGFAGVLGYSKMNFMYRMIMQSKMKDKGVQEGDYRDWNAIRAWAEGLGASLWISRSGAKQARPVGV
jgi:menaquinone-dependent protoporphyrinogen oxidase